MKRGSEYGMCPVFKWGKCVRQIFGVMKRAVKWTSTDNDTSTSVNRQPSGKVQSCRSQPRKVQYCRCRPSTLTINANKCSLQFYFWSRSTILHYSSVNLDGRRQWLPFSRSTAGSPFHHAPNFWCQIVIWAVFELHPKINLDLDYRLNIFLF